MDEDVRKLLLEWDLGAYISSFEANKIKLNVLPMLNNELARELISPIGDRAVFLNNLEVWKDLTTKAGTSTPEFVDMLNESHKKILSVSEFLSKDNNGGESQNLEETMETSNLEETMETSNLDETIHTSEPPLRDLLNKSNEGRALLNLFEKEGKLSNNGRRKICNIIVQELLKTDPSKRIDASILIEKAVEITQIFKKENISTYFIPYLNNNQLKIKRCAKGKLYDCLQNRRRDLREANIIARRRSRSTEPSSSEGNKDDSACSSNEDILWLQNNTEPFHSVQEKWINSADYRLQEIKSGNLSIEDYMTKYPILKSPRGYELLLTDFEVLYPGHANHLFENFLQIKPEIFKIALKKGSVQGIRELLDYYEALKTDNEKYEEITNILALLLLPLLIGNPVHKGKKSSWKPSRAEVRDGFITHVTRPMDIEDTIAKRREKYAKFNLTLQPTVIIVGPTYTEIHNCYVVINNVLFAAKNSLCAVDICFKCFHSLHSHYPTESSCVWTFIQKGIYKLNTEWDNNYSTVNAFATDLGIKI